MKVNIYNSDKPNKRYMAIFSDGKIVYFSSPNYSNYTIHKNDQRKNLYIKRHQKNERWDNFQSPGALARWITWNKKTIDESIKDYKKRFNLK